MTCENRVTPIPEEMPLGEAAVLGCAVLTGAGILLNTAKIRSSSSVAVFGVGGIGLSAVLAAEFAGAGTVIAVDMLRNKLDHAGAMGATHLVDASQQEPVEAIMEITQGRGLDYACEAACHRLAMETEFHSVHTDGGLCMLAGNLPHRGSIELDPYDLVLGKQIRGTRGGETETERDIPKYVDLFLSGKLKLDKLATHIYPLEDINRAMEDLDGGGVGRALIDMSLPAGEPSA